MNLHIQQIIKKISTYGIKKIVNFTALEISRAIYWQPIKKSYSQKQEDLIIDKLLNHKKIGFYVDVGANDPVRFSNTNRFYRKGWNGINIEPNPHKMEKLLKFRNRDINLNLGIATIESTLELFIFNPDTLTTFNKEEALKYISYGYELKAKKLISVKPLRQIFKQYNLKSKKIDLLSIDTEGYDLEVLKSNDWKLYKPKIICVESNPHLTNQDAPTTTSDYNIQTYLTNYRYKLISDNGLNSIYFLETEQ